MFPDFFASAPSICVLDPLARFLGVSAHGEILYRYEDAVRLAGHSCPTVASSFLATRLALKHLYGEELPKRGEIEVRFAQALDAGVTGVMGSIATLITGAATEGGFAGLAGQFSRRNKLLFGQNLSQGSIAFTRLDTGASLELGIDLSQVASDPRVGQLMPLCLSGKASEAEQQLFAQLWQERVKRLLLEHAEDPLVFKIYQ
jgi:hypothetical protein